MAGPPSRSSFPSVPGEPRMRRLGVGSSGGGDRPLRAQVIVALVCVAMLIAVPLYLWRKPSTKATAPTAVARARRPAAGRKPCPRLRRRRRRRSRRRRGSRSGPVQKVRCGVVPAASQNEGTLCDTLAPFEEALKKAVLSERRLRAQGQDQGLDQLRADHRFRAQEAARVPGRERRLARQSGAPRHQLRGQRRQDRRLEHSPPVPALRHRGAGHLRWASRQRRHDASTGAAAPHQPNRADRRFLRSSSGENGRGAGGVGSLGLSSLSCERCGGSLRAQDGTSLLRCPYCGDAAQLAPAVVEELRDYRRGVAAHLAEADEQARFADAYAQVSGAAATASAPASAEAITGAKCASCGAANGFEVGATFSTCVPLRRLPARQRSNPSARLVDRGSCRPRRETRILEKRALFRRHFGAQESLLLVSTGRVRHRHPRDRGPAVRLQRPA